MQGTLGSPRSRAAPAAAQVMAFTGRDNAVKRSSLSVVLCTLVALPAVGTKCCHSFLFLLILFCVCCF